VRGGGGEGGGVFFFGVFGYIVFWASAPLLLFRRGVVGRHVGVRGGGGGGGGVGRCCSFGDTDIIAQGFQVQSTDTEAFPM